MGGFAFPELIEGILCCSQTIKDACAYPNPIKGCGAKVSKGRCLASSNNKKTERVSRNERPQAAAIEAADACAEAKPSAACSGRIVRTAPHEALPIGRYLAG